MTLPTSGALSIAQIATELGRTGKQTIPDKGWLTLAGKSVAPIVIPTDYRGKTRAAYLGASGVDSGTTCSFASRPFGAVGPVRRVVAAVHWTAGSDNRTLATVTIGGVSAVIHVQDSHSGGGTGLGAAIASAVVPAGTSGTVSCTFSGSVADCRVATYRLVDCAINAVAEVRGFNDTSVSTVIDITGRAILILAGSGSTNTTGHAMTFGGATEVYDADIAASAGRFGGALSVNLATQANRPISLSMGTIADSGVELVAASFK